MHMPPLARLPYLFAVSVVVLALPAIAKQKGDWKTYRLGMESVQAAAFTPDSKAVAFLYWKDNLVSEKPWKVVYTTHLAVWNFESGHVEEKLTWDHIAYDRSDSWWTQRKYIQYTSDGRYLIVLDPTEVRVLDADTCATVNVIAYETPQEATAFAGDIWAIVGLSLARDGSRAAVAISNSAGANGGFVRVYDLRTGRVVREWRLREDVRSIAGVALSPNGDRVAVSVLPVAPSTGPESFVPARANNVRLMDVVTGETTAAFNTHYLAGPVLFGPDGTLLTGSINDDRSGYGLDSIKIWEARTGRLLRDIVNPHGGVHYRLDLSADGRLLLGYTGTMKPVENFVNIDSQQFQIWDFASGKVIATSPQILPLSKERPPQLSFSPDGRFVVVWWGESLASQGAPLVYEIPKQLVH